MIIFSSAAVRRNALLVVDGFARLLRAIVKHPVVFVLVVGSVYVGYRYLVFKTHVPDSGRPGLVHRAASTVSELTRVLREAGLTAREAKALVAEVRQKQRGERHVERDYAEGPESPFGGKVF